MWLLLSLGTAVCAGTSDALSKKAVATERVGLVAWARCCWGTLFLLPFVLFAPPPAEPRVFWTQVAYAVPLEVIAAFALQTALRSSPLSACLPFMAFTPVFVLMTGWISLGEKPTVLGVAGVLCVAAGAFVLHSRRSREKGAMRGPLLVLMVAFIYSINAVFAKKALNASSPMFFCGAYYGSVALALTPFQWRSPTWTTDLFRRPTLFASIGLLEAGSFLCQFNALMYGGVAYTLAIKRLSLLLSTIYGRLFFQERDIIGRALGASLMVLGAILISLAH